MDIYVMRHGEAESRAAADNLRELTRRGVAQAEWMAENIADLSSVDRIICSPYIRAKQTAALVASYTGSGVETCDHITPESDPSAAVDFFYKEKETRPFKSLLIVSHMPFVARFVQDLASESPGFFSMPTASIAKLSGEVLAKHCCELHWIKHPKI